MPWNLPTGCWSCHGAPDPAGVRAVALLVARSAADGGPVTTARCPLCRAEAVVEELPGGRILLASPESAGLGLSAFAAHLDGAGAVERRRRGQEWALAHGAALRALREARAKGRPASPDGPPEAAEAPPPRRPGPLPREEPRRGPAPPPPRPRAGPVPGPVPAAPPAEAQAARLPRTPDEARAVLGVGPGADREAVDAAYRAAARRCHPDLVAHLDAEFQALAHEKFLRIARAHEILVGAE